MVKKPSIFRRLLSSVGGSPAATQATLEDQLLPNSGLILHRKGLGSSGTKSYGGYSNEEYFQDLRGRRAADVFDKMRRSDPQVMMCLRALKNPIKSAVWEIEAADETPEAEQDKAFIEHILFDQLDGGFQQFLSEALTMVEFGHAVFEVTHNVVIDDPEFGTYNGLASMGWRSPRTIERWNLDPETSKLLSIDQYSYGDLQRLVRIPSQFLLVFSLEREGSNFEGVSMLRQCYGCWFRKDNYMKLNAIGVEKFAIPTPVAKIESGRQGDPEFDALAGMLEAYAMHDSSYVIVTKDVELDFNTNTYDPAKVEASIDAEDKRMVKAFLANFLELGTGGNGGAYALSNDLSDFFLSGIEHVARHIEDPINQILIPSLIKMNSPDSRKAYPRLKHSGISDKAGEELAKVMHFLVNAQIIVPDDKLEASMRKRYGLPEVSLEGQRHPAPQGGGGGSGLGLAEKIRLAEEKRRGRR